MMPLHLVVLQWELNSLKKVNLNQCLWNVNPKLKGKKIALFGSYGWGDGEWMRTWEETCIGDGAVMACDFVICQETPDEEAESECKNLGKALI